MDKRLAAVAKELNKGMQTLCDYLAQKGFGELSPNPSTKISEEMHNSLLKEFGSSAVLKKQADEIRIELRGKRKDAPVAPPVVNTPTTESHTPPVVVVPPVSDIPKKEETIKNDTKKVSVNEDKVENKNSVPPKVLGKIDLSQFAPKPKGGKPDQPKAEAKKETPKVDTPEKTINQIKYDSSPSVLSQFNPITSLNPKIRTAVNNEFILPILKRFFLSRGGLNNFSELNPDKLRTEIEFENNENFVKTYIYKEIIDKISKEGEEVKFKPKYVITFDRDLANYAVDENNIKYGVIRLGNASILYYILIDLQELIRFIKKRKE
jgi:hypothetical protein